MGFGRRIENMNWMPSIDLFMARTSFFLFCLDQRKWFSRHFNTYAYKWKCSFFLFLHKNHIELKKKNEYNIKHLFRFSYSIYELSTWTILVFNILLWAPAFSIVGNQFNKMQFIILSGEQKEKKSSIDHQRHSIASRREIDFTHSHTYT